MRDVERLLERARAIKGSFQFGLFPDDDDGFMEALGVDKSKYEVKYQDGTVGYDFLAALNDLAAEDWNEDEEPSRTDVRHEAAPEEVVKQDEVPDKVRPEEVPKKKVQRLFGWG